MNAPLLGTVVSTLQLSACRRWGAVWRTSAARALQRISSAEPHGVSPGRATSVAPLVLMVDQRTIGSYPRTATVFGVDLPRLAQRWPQEVVRFRAVSPREAVVDAHDSYNWNLGTL